jgi:F0F1-type ATP synthase membrane subunit b/b'
MLAIAQEGGNELEALQAEAEKVLAEARAGAQKLIAEARAQGTEAGNAEVAKAKAVRALPERVRVCEEEGKERERREF